MTTASAHTDQELFRLISEGDEAAFESIFHTYNARLLPFVNSITKSHAASEEIMQDVFLKLWLHRASLASVEQPAAWLTRVASNLSLNYLKKKAVKARALQIIEERQSPGEYHIEEEIDAKKVQLLIEQAVEKLPPKRQMIYKLSREEGLTRREIAAMLHLSESTVKNQISAALESIMESIRQSTGIYIPVFLLLLLH